MQPLAEETLAISRRTFETRHPPISTGNRIDLRDDDRHKQEARIHHFPDTNMMVDYVFEDGMMEHYQNSIDATVCPDSKSYAMDAMRYP